MKILITTSTFPFAEGDGQARFVLDLATALSAQADVTVLAPHARRAATRERVGDVNVRRFRYFLPASLERLSYGSGMRHNIEHSLLARIQVPFLLAAQTFATLWRVLVDRPTVINAHWLVPQGLTSAVAARVLRVPLVLHIHAADVYFLRRLRLGRSIARFVVRTSASVFTAGGHVRVSLDELLGFESGATLRPMGVSLETFRSGEPGGHDLSQLPRRFVVFVGRLVEKKGVEYLIKAMRRVREDIPDMELLIVGSGPLQQELGQLSERLGLSEVVHFFGTRQHDEIAVLLQTAEVACVPSIIDSRGETEGMPTVVLEAMASGARVVGSRVNGIPDVLKHAENGWLVEPADAESLATGLVRAATSPNADAIARAGIRTAERHDWGTVGKEYGSALEAAAHD